MRRIGGKSRSDPGEEEEEEGGVKSSKLKLEMRRVSVAATAGTNTSGKDFQYFPIHLSWLFLPLLLFDLSLPFAGV